MFISFQRDRLLHFGGEAATKVQIQIQKEKLTQIMIGSCVCLSTLTLLTAEVRQSHVLQRDLLQEARTLAARVTCHNLPTPQPITEPGQPAVTVEGVGQEVTGRGCALREVVRKCNEI